MLNRLILKVTKFQLPTPKRLRTVVKNIWGGPSCPPPCQIGLKQLCGGNWDTDMEEEAKKSYDLSACFIKVTKNDIEEFMMKNKWKPRFHPGLLNNVIDNSMFDNEESK